MIIIIPSQIIILKSEIHNKLAIYYDYVTLVLYNSLDYWLAMSA